MILWNYWKKRITTNKKQPSKEDKQRRFTDKYTEFTGDEFSVKHAYLLLYVRQKEKGNSKQTNHSWGKRK